MEKKVSSSKLNQITHSFKELNEIRESMKIDELIKRDYLIKRVVEHAKENRKSDEVSKLVSVFVIPLIMGEKGEVREAQPDISENSVKLSQNGMKYGLLILRELSKKTENISAILGHEESGSMNILTVIKSSIEATKDFDIIEIAIECLHNMRSSKILIEFLYEDDWLLTLTENYLIVVKASSQVNLLRIWQECVRWEKCREWLAEHNDTMQFLLICMQGNTEEVTLEALQILAFLSKHDRFLEIYRQKKLLDILNNIFAFPLKEHSKEIQRKMAFIIKNILRFLIHQNEKLKEINEELLLNIIKLAKSPDEKTKLYGVTSIAYLSKKKEFTSGYMPGYGKGTKEDLMHEIYEVMTGLTQFMKQNKLNKQACKFLANLAKHNMTFDHSIMAFLFNCLTSPDPDLQKYSVKALSCVRISQLSGKFIVSLLHLLDVEDERGEKVKEYASLTMAKISKDPTMQAELVKEPEISSIKHALDLANSSNLTLNLITVVGNLSKSQTIPDIHYILYQKGFLEALIKVLENQRKQQGLQLSNPKIYAKTVDAISGLAYRHITQDKLIQYNVFKRILEPHSLAPEAEQKIVAVAITNMLYTSPLMKQDFIDHGGIKYLQFLLSNKTKLFKRAGVKCVSLLSEHYNLLTQIVKEGIIEDVMKKLMIYELLDKDILTDILRLTISQLLWNVKVNINDIIPLIEISLMVNDSLINALGLYIFSQICLRRNIHQTILHKNLLGIVCNYTTTYLARVDPQYEISIKQFLSESWANLVRNIDVKTHFMEKEIYKWLPIIFTPSSQIVVANCSFILQRLAELLDVPDIMIDTSIVDMIYKILTDEESWFLVREMLWTLSIICKSRTILKEFAKIIPALVTHALTEHPAIRLQSMMVLAALSYEYENHQVFLKYRFLEEVTKIKPTFKEDDERYTPIIIILSNLSANTNIQLSLSCELATMCMQLIGSTRPDDILFKEACKAFANITYLHQFDPGWVSLGTFSELHEIIKKDQEKSYHAFLSTLIAMQNLSAKQEFSEKFLEKGVFQDLISIVKTRAATGPAEVALAIGTLANIYMSSGEVDDAVIELVLGIMQDLHSQTEELSIEQRHLLTSCLSFVYSILKSSPEKLTPEMMETIITQIATKWCDFPEQFVERIVMKLTLIFACNETAAKLTLSFDDYCLFIMRCMTESQNPEVRNDAVIVVAYMASYPSLVSQLIIYDRFYQHLDELFDYFGKDKEKRDVKKYFLNMLIVLFKYENIRKVACTVPFAEKVIQVFLSSKSEEMQRILYKIIYFLSFSECTHPIIAQDQAEPNPEDPAPKSALALLLEAYDNNSGEAAYKSEGSILQCLEMILANLTFTFGTHPALIKLQLLDRLKEQYQSVSEPCNVRLPIALTYINIGLNSDNLKLLEEDFLLCVILAKDVKGVSDAIKLRLLKAFGEYLNFVKENMSHFDVSIFSLLEKYIMHIFQLENRSDELGNTVISILLNITNSIHSGFIYLFIQMNKLSKFLLSKFTWKRDSTESYYDKEGNIDAKALVVGMKIAEIVLRWATSAKFFEVAKNEQLHDWMHALMEFGNRLTKLRKDCKFEKINQILQLILSTCTDYSMNNGSMSPFLDNIRRSSIASVILNNLLVKPEIPPQLNLESLGCLANYSQYSEFLEKKELHECDVINRSLVVYFAYKDYVDIPDFQSFLIAVLHHFAQNSAFHLSLGKRQFNLLPLLEECATKELPPDEESSSPNDLSKMLDIYEQLTRSIAKAIKHNDLIEKLCTMIKQGKNMVSNQVEQALSSLCNLAANKQVNEEEKSIEMVLKCLKEVHGKHTKAFLAYCPQIISGYLRKWDDSRIHKFFDIVIELVKNLLSNSEKGNVGLLFRQMDKLCRPPDLLKRLVQSSDILTNLCTILSGFLRAPAGQANLPRVIEILNILQFMSLIEDSHKEIRKPIGGPESILELCFNVYKSTSTLDGEKDSLTIKLISSVIHILRNIFKKSTNDHTKEYAEKSLIQHIKYFYLARKILEGEDTIRDEIVDVLIKILWSFCSIREILDKEDGVELCRSFANIGEKVGTIFTNKQEERAKEKVKNLIYVMMKYVKHYKPKINLVAIKEIIRLCGLEKKVLLPETKFELILIMNSIEELPEALDHKKAMQVYQLLVLNYEDPVIIYYCTEVIYKLFSNSSPEILINLWCFVPLIESMIQKLKEYSIERVSHPLLEAVSSKILDSFESLFASEATVQWLLQTTLISYLVYSIMVTPQTTARQKAVNVLLKTLEFPITYPELLHQSNLNKLLKVLVTNGKTLCDVQPKIYSLIKGAILKVKLPALAHIVETILQITEQDDSSLTRTTYAGNLLMLLFDCIKSQGISKNEDVVKMAEKSIENCFKAFSNMMGKKTKLRYSSEIQRYLCNNIDLYKVNSQFFLRGIHIMYKVFLVSKEWLRSRKVIAAIPFLMETLNLYSKVLEKEPKYIEIPHRSKGEEQKGESMAGYFFERKEEFVFTEYDAESLILTYAVAIIALISKNLQGALSLSEEGSFSLLSLFLKSYSGSLRVQNALAVLKTFRRVFAHEQTQERLAVIDVGPKIIELGKFCKDGYPEIVMAICKYLTTMAEFPQYHPYFMTCGVLSFLKNILETFKLNKEVFEEGEKALKLFEESTNTNIQLLNDHKIFAFIKSLTMNLAPDQLYGYVKYLKMMLIQGFIEPAEMDKNAVYALMDFSMILLQSDIKDFKDNIFKEFYEILNFLLPTSAEYAGILIRKEIAEIAFESMRQKPVILGEVASFFVVLTKQSPDGVIPYLNQEKVIDVLGSLPIELSNCTQDDMVHVLELLNQWFDHTNYYSLYFSQDILKLVNKIAFHEYLKYAVPLKQFASLIKKMVANGALINHAVSSLNFDLFRKLINNEDSSIQITGIYPLHILTQQKIALKYMDIEMVDKLVSCAQSPISEVRILSVSALANILEHCHNPLLVVCHQNWAFLNTITHLLDSSSGIEKSLALRSFALLSFDVLKMWNPLVIKYEKAKEYLESIGESVEHKLKEPIGKPDVAFEDVCQGFISAICSGIPQQQFLALTAVCSCLLDSEDNLTPKTCTFKSDLRTMEGVNSALIDAYDLEGVNYHTLSLLFHRLRLPEIIAKTIVSSTDKGVKKVASLAFISLVYGLLPQTGILTFDMEKLKSSDSKEVVKLRTDVKTLVFDYLKDMTPSLYYDTTFAKDTFTFGEEYVSQLATYAASAECLIHSPETSLSVTVHNILGAFFSESQPKLKVSVKNEEDIPVREVETQTNIMNAIFMSTLFLTNIYLCSQSAPELELYSLPTIEYAFNVLDGINPRSKYDLVALIQSYNYSYDKNSLYQREVKNKHKGFEYAHRASTFFTKTIFYLIYLALKHFPTKKGPSLQQINKKLHTLMQATANNTSDKDTSLLYYSIQMELLNKTENYVNLIGEGMDLYLSIQCYHILVFHFDVAAQFFVQLLSYDNMKYLPSFKQTHTKVALTEIIKTEKDPVTKEKAENLLRILNNK